MTSPAIGTATRLATVPTSERRPKTRMLGIGDTGLGTDRHGHRHRQRTQPVQAPGEPRAGAGDAERRPDGQPEPDRPGEQRVDEEQHDDSHGQRTHRLALAAEGVGGGSQRGHHPGAQHRRLGAASARRTSRRGPRTAPTARTAGLGPGAARRQPAAAPRSGRRQPTDAPVRCRGTAAPSPAAGRGRRRSRGPGPARRGRPGARPSRVRRGRGRGSTPRRSGRRGRRRRAMWPRTTRRRAARRRAVAGRRRGPRARR